MILPGKFDVVALRWQPLKLTFDFVGFNFTGGTFGAQVRSYRDAPDPALITLSNAASPSQGLSVTVDTSGDLPVSTIELRINESTIEGLPFPNPRGPDLELAWDLVITGGGFDKSRWLEGKFTVHGGSTQT